MAWKRIYREFRDQFTDEKGVQESNLTIKESRGLEKLKREGGRVGRGEVRQEQQVCHYEHGGVEKSR